jgi:hypothetical protein
MSDENAMAPADHQGVLHEEPASRPMLPFNLSHVLPPMLVGGSGAYNINACLFAFQQQRMMQYMVADAHLPFVAIPQALRPEDPSYTLRTGAAAAHAPYSTGSDSHPLLMNHMLWQNDSSVPDGGRETRDFAGREVLGGGLTSTQEQTTRNDTAENDLSESLLSILETQEQTAWNDAAENHLSESLLSILEASDHPRFTEEHEALEQAAMTDEERAAALSDLFGKQCAVDAHQKKRARRDLDKDAIIFLVNQMRLEIERIPLDRKRALDEAQLKCHANEFSDARLERFLRCEGMNAKVCIEMCMRIISDNKNSGWPTLRFCIC